MMYTNAVFKHTNQELIDHTHKFFKTSKISIGQLTRKLVPFLSTYVQRYHDTVMVFFALCKLSNDDYVLEADIHVIKLHKENNLNMTINIHAPYPDKLLWPFFCNFWDRDKTTDDPIQSQKVITMHRHGAYSICKELLPPDNGNLFATLTICPVSMSFKEKCRIWFLDLIGSKTHYLNTYEYINLRPREERSGTGIVRKILNQAFGMSYYI